MKHIILSALLLPVALFAQAPQRTTIPYGRVPQAQILLPENYQLVLSLTDKDNQATELAVVVAAAQFSIQLSDPALSFSGTLNVEEGGSIVVDYTLNLQTPVRDPSGSTQMVGSGFQSSVRLKAGEEIQILRTGMRTARLIVKKLDAPKAK